MAADIQLGMRNCSKEAKLLLTDGPVFIENGQIANSSDCMYRFTPSKRGFFIITGEM